MVRALVPLLLAAAGSRPAPVIREDATAAPPPDVVRLATADDVASLCRALVPAERLRSAGDAVQRGEAEDRHDADRDRAIERRYQVLIPAARIAFAPYDPGTHRLGLSYRSELRAADGALRVWAVAERGLPVEVSGEGARRIVAARTAGRLVLDVVFDLPDDATCGGVPRTRRWALPMDPVSWAYRDGEVILARGGAGDDRPLLTARDGARPRIDVGEPISGALAAREAVAAHRAALEACYAAALRRDPGLDGVIVLDLSPGKADPVADSVGDPGLAGCVREALAGAGVERAAVPVRFTLEPPGAEPAGGR
jgi:hypothetical protein